MKILQKSPISKTRVWIEKNPGFRVSKKALKPGFSGSGKPGLETLVPTNYPQ